MIEHSPWFQITPHSNIICSGAWKDTLSLRNCMLYPTDTVLFTEFCDWMQMSQMSLWLNSRKLPKEKKTLIKIVIVIFMPIRYLKFLFLGGAVERVDNSQLSSLILSLSFGVTFLCMFFPHDFLLETRSTLLQVRSASKKIWQEVDCLHMIASRCECVHTVAWNGLVEIFTWISYFLSIWYVHFLLSPLIVNPQVYQKLDDLC